jgi:hypothetical protein
MVCRPKTCFSVGLQQLKPTTMLSISRRLGSVVGKRPRPSSPAWQLWNERRPLMFLWLSNNQFRRPGWASWQAVALCRGINRRL